MKKLTALIFALCMALGLFAGCGGESEPAPTAESTQAPPVTQTTAPERSDPDSENAELEQLSENQSLSPLTTRFPVQAEEKPYTIMVYMVGSNLESQAGCASDDIEEMLESGFDTKNCNVVIYTGGSKSWQMSIPSECNTVWTVDPSEEDLVAVAATGEPVNMGKPAVLADFINYAVGRFPADQYGLICWDHGTGPVLGFGNDELFLYDSLTLSEMQTAMDATIFEDEKLSFIGFDACLMASIEVADIFSDYAEYLVASEEVEPGTGWDYSFLAKLNHSDSTEDLLLEILNTYENSMESSIWNPEYTLSCMELSKVDDVMNAMDDLFTEMSDELSSDGYSKLAQARDETKRFGMGSVSDKGSSLDLVDLGDMVQNLPSSYQEKAEALAKAVDELIVAQVSNIPETCGVSIYYPYDNKDLFSEGGLTLLGKLNRSEGYQDYIDAFSEMWINGKSAADWSPIQKNAPQQDEKTISVQLSDEQRKDLSAAYYTILIYNEDDMGENTYSPVIMDCEVRPDENGVIQVPIDPNVMIMYTDSAYDTSGEIWPVRQVETSAGQNTYATVGTHVFATTDITSGTENLQIVASENTATGALTIQSVYSTTANETGTYGKTEPDLENYGFIAKNLDYLYPTYDENHALLPYDQWEENGWIAYSLMGYENTFRLEAAPASSVDHDFFCQIVLKDTKGNTYGTELIELPTPKGYETVERDGLTFKVYEDEAVLVGYSGTGTEVVIPATVNGVDVTTIGSYVFEYCKLTKVTIPDTVHTIGGSAFSGNSTLTTVNFPKNLKFIGFDAFSYSGLTELNLPEGLEAIEYGAFSGIPATEVTLPSGLQYVGDGIFANCRSLTDIHMADGGIYKSVDGVLFTADGKNLVQFPTGRTGEYAIPTGVETVCGSAFYGANSMTGITFPEGLKEIETYAFNDVVYLQELTLPDSLERIGHKAFGTPLFFLDLEETARPVDSITIGPNVNWIGSNAFDGYLLKEFVVDSANRHLGYRL